MERLSGAQNIDHTPSVPGTACMSGGGKIANPDISAVRARGAESQPLAIRRDGEGLPRDGWRKDGSRRRRNIELDHLPRRLRRGPLKPPQKHAAQQQGQKNERRDRADFPASFGSRAGSAAGLTCRWDG